MNAGILPRGYKGLGVADLLRDCTQPGIVCIDFKTGRAGLSREACRLLELSPTDVALALLPAGIRELAQNILHGENLAALDEFELKLSAHRNLRAKWFLWGEPAGEPRVILCLHDPGDLSRLEGRLENLDRLSSAGTLAATTAHEIKNALVACRTFIDLLLERNSEAELADVVRREMGRIDAMLGRMLRFSGSTAAPRFQLVSVHGVLEHSLRLVQPQLSRKQIVLERAFEAALDRTRGDEYELEQAFVNLFLNALEATSANGILKVSTTLSEGRGESPSGIQITIQDTGAGIPPENLPHLFEPFFTTKAGGTGLGLAVTKRVVRDHGGSITAESQLGNGATFRILLPLALEAQKPIETDLRDSGGQIAGLGASPKAASG